MQLTARHQEYWRKNLQITALLLGIWFFVTFVVVFFARELTFNFFGCFSPLNSTTLLLLKNN